MLLNILKTLGHVLVILLILTPCAVMPYFTLDGDINLLSMVVCMGIAFSYYLWAFSEKLGLKWEHINF